MRRSRSLCASSTSAPAPASRNCSSRCSCASLRRRAWSLKYCSRCCVEEKAAIRTTGSFPHSPTPKAAARVHASRAAAPAHLLLLPLRQAARRLTPAPPSTSTPAAPPRCLRPSTAAGLRLPSICDGVLPRFQRPLRLPCSAVPRATAAVREGPRGAAGRGVALPLRLAATEGRHGLCGTSAQSLATCQVLNWQAYPAPPTRARALRVQGSAPVPSAYPLRPPPRTSLPQRRTRHPRPHPPQPPRQPCAACPAQCTQATRRRHIHTTRWPPLGSVHVTAALLTAWPVCQLLRPPRRAPRRQPACAMHAGPPQGRPLSACRAAPGGHDCVPGPAAAAARRSTPVARSAARYQQPSTYDRARVRAHIPWLNASQASQAPARQRPRPEPIACGAHATAARDLTCVSWARRQGDSCVAR
jgi:hypothetical protein